MDSILNTAPCGFLAFTDDGILQAANDTLLDALGRSREAVVGAHVETLLSPGAKLFYHTHLLPMLKMEERVEEVYLSLNTADGPDLPCILNAQRAGRNDETVNEVVILPFEERDQYEDEILQAKQAAEQANRAKDKFLSTMSHELRTPISTIKSLSQYLALGVRGSVTEEQEEYLNRIDEAADYLDTLVTDILDFARLEAGPVSVNLESVPVSEALDRTESLLEVRFEEAAVTYEREPVPAPVHVRADPDRLQQILLNLLTNALKFTPAEGSVTTAVAAQDGTAHIHVRDTGVGIPAEEQTHIFDPFVQAPEPNRDGPSKGVGLGLAISRDLAEAMGGALTVESEEGVGSAFTIELPLSDGPDEP